MSVSITKENFFWHKLHSLTGIIPIGFYMLQHLVLNTFSLAGPDYFNGVIGFFDGMPFHFLLILEITLIWLPLLFHALYGFVIINHSQPNYPSPKYPWAENRMYLFQRISGAGLFLFLIYHILQTTLTKYVNGDSQSIRYAAMHNHFENKIILVVYLVGILFASYHLSYGVWNFCIRWGITVSERAQHKMRTFAMGMFIVVTIIGWAAILGFLIPKYTAPANGITAMGKTSSQSM